MNHINLRFQTSVHVDLARSFLCRELARIVNGDANEVRIRVHHASRPDHVWIYVRRHNAWEKQSDAIDQPDLAQEINRQLEMLATRGKTDELSIRHHCKPDFDDTELQFNKEWMDSRRGPHLASHLAGVLFRDGHDHRRDPPVRISDGFQKGFLSPNSF